MIQREQEGFKIRISNNKNSDIPERNNNYHNNEKNVVSFDR